MLPDKFYPHAFEKKKKKKKKKSLGDIVNVSILPSVRSSLCPSITKEGPGTWRG